MRERTADLLSTNKQLLQEITERWRAETILSGEKRILELIDSKGYARVVDIATGLKISQASVTNMVQRLDAAPASVVGIGGAIQKYAVDTIVRRYGITIDDGQADLNYLPALHLPYVTGANSAYRMEAVRNCGGYDEQFVCGDDVDLSYRLGLAGSTLGVEPGAIIRYTLDGSAPIKSSPIYHGPLELTEPATLRARAYKDGTTRSIIVQETFIVDE